MAGMLQTRRWATLAVLATAVAVVTAQDQVPDALQLPDLEFHVEVNYVEVDARVLDASGNFVRDLTKDDFQIFEDGVPQEIDRFALVDIPVERPEMPLFATEPIHEDVATNAREFDGRLYLLVLDDLHIAPLRTQFARQAAREFIETRLGANDLAAVVTTRGTSLDMQGFTNDRERLLDAVDHFIGQKLQSETIMAVNTPEVVDLDNEDTRFAPGSDPIKLQRALNANAAMITLRNAAEFMAGIRGRRKALIYFSEGIDYDVYDTFNNREASQIVATSRDAIAAATRANVSIYAIDPRGLSTLGDDIIELGGQPPDATSDVGQRSLLREQQTSHDSLRELADLTGGFAAVNASDSELTFDRIVTENSSYYVLGYYAANARREGRVRGIDVRVRRPGVQVFSRDNYIEPRANQTLKVPGPSSGAPEALLDTVRSPLPLTGLTMSATAAAFRGADGKASVPVVVEIKGDELGLLDEGDRHTGKLDLAVWGVGPGGGSEVSGRIETNLTLRPATFERLNQYGLRVVLQVEAPPGRYQFRVGALTPDTGLRGSVFYDLDVPDFSRDLLSMSHLLLTSATASRMLTVQNETGFEDVLPAAPTAIREFPVDDQIAVLAEIYDNDPRPHLVDITGNILTDTGDLVFTTSESRSSEEFGKAGVGAYGYTTRVPLGAFAPGLYVLRIQARSRAGRAEPVTRELQFRVRG